MKKYITTAFLSLNILSINSFASMSRDDANNIIKDSSAYLVWQDDSRTKTTVKTWSDAISYCENLNFANHTNWRLPNVNELLSIVDFEQRTNFTNPIFKNKEIKQYWSSTSFDDNNAWFVNFHNNSTTMKTISDKESTHYVRCVYSFPRFVRDDSKEVVVDTEKDLMWQDNASSKNMKKNWEEANQYCQNSNFAGYDDWDLPMKNELEEMYNDTKENNPFVNNVNDYYWTSLDYTAFGTRKFVINFNDGLSTGKYKGPLTPQAVKVTKNIKMIIHFFIVASI